VLRKLFVTIALAALALLAWEWATFPDVAALEKSAPKTTAFMDLRRAELRAAGKDDTLQYRFVPYGRISPYLRRAVLVAEDDTFYEHDAVDVKGLQEAFEKDWKRKQLTHGGSTITQQLAKNLYLSPSRNPLRKVKEYFIARALERHLTKKRILELYLNVVEMGARVYGAEAASRFYFHQPASGLNPSQAALLAGCLPNPRVMSPAAPNKRLRFRQRMILSRMKRWGYLFEKEVLTEKTPAADPPTATASDTAATESAAPAPVPATDSDLAPIAPGDTATPPPAVETIPPSNTNVETTTAASPPTSS
jgi:monofunctional biosynthetic peptidoglycan transglycosylase